MKIILEAADDTPLVSFQLANRVGSVIDPDGLEGLVHHSAELSMRGAGSMSRQDIDEQIDRLGASLGFAVRRDYLSLTGTCLARHFDALFTIAMEIISAPHFELKQHQKLQRETQIDLDDLRDDDSALAHRFFSAYWQPGHHYSRTAMGTQSSIKNFKVETIKELFPRLFRKESLCFGVTGPVSQTHIETLSKTIASQENVAPIEPPQLPLYTPPKGRRLILVNKPDRGLCQIVLGQLAPKYGSSIHDCMQIATTALGGMFTSRLMQEIRVKHGWSYGAHASMYSARDSHMFQISLAPAAEQCAAALSRTLEMLEEFSSQGLAEEEFEFTRSYLIGRSAFSQATVRQRLHRKIQEEVLGISPGYGNHFSKRIQKIDTTMVNQAIRESVTPADQCIVVIASADTTLKSLEPLGFDSIEVVDYRSY